MAKKEDVAKAGDGPLKEAYTPEDLKDFDYHRDVNKPGEYPFTGGLFADIAQRRGGRSLVVVGFGLPRDTNERFKYMERVHGQQFFTAIPDLATDQGIDYDHPLAEGEAGQAGCPFCSLQDMEETWEGIPIEKRGIGFSTLADPSPVILAQLVALCEKRGLDPRSLTGYIGASPANHFFGNESIQPWELSWKLIVDEWEYLARQKMRLLVAWAGVPMRQGEITAAQELAFTMNDIRELNDALLERGLDIDDFARLYNVIWGVRVGLFEEVARLRAGRRMFARMMREEYGAKNPRSWILKMSGRGIGNDFQRQQPFNNIIRGVIQQLASALGGVQGASISTFDEPFCIPTKFACRLGMNTAYVIAYETDGFDVGDPMAGSYYVEHLTNETEKEATRIMNEIQAMGGIAAAAQKGYVDRMTEHNLWEKHEKMASKEKIIVGVNDFVIPKEEEETFPIERVQTASEEVVKNLRELKKTRDNKKVREALENLRANADIKKKVNLLPYMIEASKAYATIGEIWGTFREANGYSYDPLNMIESPFK